MPMQPPDTPPAPRRRSGPQRKPANSRTNKGYHVSLSHERIGAILRPIVAADGTRIYTTKTIMDEVSMSKSSATSLLRQMEDLGYIIRGGTNYRTTMVLGPMGEEWIAAHGNEDSELTGKTVPQGVERQLKAQIARLANQLEQALAENAQLRAQIAQTAS